MPKIIPYHLRFRSGVHLGTRGINTEEAAVSIPSDTLFAALLDAWQTNSGKADQFMEPFIQAPASPPFLITSAFPFVENVRFFPMPVDLSGIFEADTLQKRAKDIKKIQYFSYALLQKALRGEKLDADLFPRQDWEEPEKGAALQEGALWFSLEEINQLPDHYPLASGRQHALRRQKVWSTGRVPRVTVSRSASMSNLFHTGRVVFAASCGLWFGVQWRNPDATLGDQHPTSYQSAFNTALKMLEDQGLGGERSTGYGAFQAQKQPHLQLSPEMQPDSLCYLLSRYHPRQEELPHVLNGHPHSAYHVTPVGGWLHSPSHPAQRRKQILLLKEGSLVAAPKNQPMGGVVDVQPQYAQDEDGSQTAGVAHPVYRYGFGLSTGWTSPQERS